MFKVLNNISNPSKTIGLGMIRGPPRVSFLMNDFRTFKFFKVLTFLMNIILGL